MPLSERDIDLLSAYLDDALDESERAEFMQALAQSPELQRELTDWQAMQRALAALPVLRAPRDFTLTPAQARPVRVLVPVWRVLSAAALLVLLAGVGVLFVRQQSAPASSDAIALLATSPASAEPQAISPDIDVADDSKGGERSAPTIDALTTQVTPAPTLDLAAAVVTESAPLTFAPAGGIVETFGMDADVQDDMTPLMEQRGFFAPEAGVQGDMTPLVQERGFSAEESLSAMQTGEPPAITAFAETAELAPMAAALPTQGIRSTLGGVLEAFWQLVLRVLALWLGG